MDIDLLFDRLRKQWIDVSDKDEKAFESEVDKRAEDQVADTKNAIREQVLINLDRWDSKEVAFDRAMDAELARDFDELKSLLLKVVPTLQLTKNHLETLASAINFKLTDRGNSVMDVTQSQSYLKEINKTPEQVVNDCLTNSNVTSSVAKVDKTPSQGNESCAPEQKSSKIESAPISTESRNQISSYRPENIRCGSDDIVSRDRASTKSQARTALREWIRGTNDELNFVAEGDKVGDRKVDLATKEDKQILKENLYKPLKILCVNNKEWFLSGLRRRVSEQWLDEDKIWRQLMSTYNTSKGDMTSEAYREWVVNSGEFQLLSWKSDNFAKWMSKLWNLYRDYRDKKYSGWYIEKVMGMLDNEFKVNNDGYEDVADKKWYERIIDANNRNNDAIKNLNLWWYKILDGKSDNSARKNLESMGVNLNEATAYGQSLVETNNVKALVDHGWFASAYDTTNEEGFANFLWDTSFSGGVDNSDMAMRQWQQILAQFRIAVEQYALMNGLDANDRVQLKAAQSGVLRNVLSFVQLQANRNTDRKYNKISEELKNVIGGTWDIWKYLIGDKENKWSASGSFLSKNPGMLKFMQKTLSDHPGAMDGIMLYGNTWAEVKMQAQYKEASDASLQQAIEWLTPEQQAQFKEVYNNNKSEIATYIKKYQESHTTNAMSEQQLLQSIALSTVHALSQNIVAPYLWGDLNKVATTLTNDTKLDVWWKPLKATINWVDVTGAVGAGWSIALPRNLKLNYGLATNGSTIVPSLSISTQQDLWWGFRAGEQVHLIVPGYSQTLTKTFTWWDKTANNLDTISSKSTTIWLDGTISVLWLSGGVGFFRERDILKGIDTGYEHRKTEWSKIISNIINAINVNSDSTSIKKAIATQIAKNYPNSDPQKQQYMVENLHAAMVSYGCGVKSGIDKNVLIDQLTQAFAGEWKNQAITGLKWTKLTGWGMRLWVSTNPWETALNIFTLGTGLKFTNFNRGFHYEETAESLAALDDAEHSGKNNRLLSQAIGQKEVNFMNRMFETTHHRMMHNVSDIEYNSTNNTVRIPQALWDSQWQVNVKISSLLRGHIKMDDQWYLVVPANIPMSLNAFPQVSWVEYTLSVWSPRVESDALHLITGKGIPQERQADTMDGVKIENGKWADPLTKEKVESAISSLKSQKPWYYDAFDVQVISADNTWVKIKVDWQKYDLPARGGWEVMMKDGKFLVSPKTGSTTDTFSLKFVNSDKKWSGSWTVSEEIKNITYNEVDTDLEKNAISAIDSNLSLIESIENTKSAQFYSFLNEVMERDTEWASKQLLNMFGQELPALKAALESSDRSVKEVVVSRMLSIFALEDKSYKNKTIGELIERRRKTAPKLPPAYTRIGENHVDFLDRDDFKSAFDMNMKLNESSSNKVDNVLWYTAFYRMPRNGNNKHRGFALTTPWYTDVLWSTKDIPSSKQSKAKEWLQNTVEKDDFAKRAIRDALKGKLNAYGALSDTQVIPLMKWEPIVLWWATIKLNTTPVFYFLAQCANESIGLKINSITITKDGKEEIIDGGLWQDIKFNAGSGGSLYVNTTDTRGTAAISWARSAQFGAWVALRANWWWWDDGYTRWSSETGWSNQQNHSWWSTNTWWSTNWWNVPWDMPTNP